MSMYYNIYHNPDRAIGNELVGYNADWIEAISYYYGAYSVNYVNPKNSLPFGIIRFLFTQDRSDFWIDVAEVLCSGEIIYHSCN